MSASGASRKPVIFVVDDHLPTLQTIARDLEHRFGQDYRIVTANSSTEGIDTLRGVAASGVRVSIIAAELNMATMNGVEFLELGAAIHREAKRILLVSMNRRGIVPGEHVIELLQNAMTLGRVDQTITVGWESPEEFFYPSIQTALGNWASSHLPHVEIVRVVGGQWDPATHTLRDTLNRNVVPFGFYDVSSDEGEQLLRSVGAERADLPVVIFRDGFVLSRPTPLEVADALGARTSPGSEIYDVAILGAGPAGLAAAVYAASEGLRTLVIEAHALGGQAGTSSMIRNYLGFPEGVPGNRLTARAYEQALHFGATFLFMQKAGALNVEDDHFVVTLAQCEPARARSVLVAIGMQYRRLNIPALERLVGAGVYYGSATVEAPAMVGQHVVVVGGANSAGQAATHLAKFARQVTMVVRGESLATEMSHYLIEQIEATPNIEVLLRTQVVAASGEHRLASVTLRQTDTGVESEIEIAAIFLLIGSESCSNWLAGTLEMDDWGYIVTGRDVSRDRWPLARAPHEFETSVPGVFAAGDVRHGSVKRVAGAVGEGSVTVGSIHRWLAERASLLTHATARE